MRPKHLIRQIIAMYSTKYRRPISLWGPPGVGKTDIAQQAAKALGINYWELNLTCHDSGDIKFPVVRQNRQPGEAAIEWVCSLLPNDPDWCGLVCLDELAQCDTSLLKAICQVLLARRVGEYMLPKGAMVVCTSNRQEDRAGANRVITPVLGRLYHYDVDVNLDDWTEWAEGYGIDYRIRSFLQYQPTMLHDFKPESLERSFASPRGYMYASDALEVTPSDLLLETFRGCIGEKASSQLLGFLQIHDDLERRYPIQKILIEPDAVEIPRRAEGAVIWALCGALSEKSKTKEKPVVHNCMKYIMRMPPEFAAYGVRSVIKAAGSMMALTAPGANEYVARNKGIIFPD